MPRRTIPALLPLAVLFAFVGCENKPDKRGDVPPPPPPSASVAKAGTCDKPGEVKDAVSAGFFPAKVKAYCVDPAGETMTYGEKGKLTMDEVCTTAFDGECEVYKAYGLKRVVKLSYVDGDGKGGVVEVTLSQFDGDGAFGMFTKRLVAGDPTDKATPRPVAVKGLAAMGTGRAYVWRAQHLVELQYNNEREAPAALAASSDAILGAMAKELADKLPGSPDKPAAARALPEQDLVPGGIEWFTKDTMGVSGLGAGAVGYYKSGDKRWRAVRLAVADEAAAKDAMKAAGKIKGALPIKDAGDDAWHVALQASKDAPVVEVLFARKGAVVVGVADEEYALRAAGSADKQKAVRVSKEDALARVKTLLTVVAPGPQASSGPASSGAPSSTAAPSAAPSTSAAPKK